MPRTLLIAVFALAGGWLSGDLVHAGGMGGAFLFLLFALTWPVVIVIAARRFAPLLAAIPGVAMGVRVAVINHLDPRFYNDLGENMRWGVVLSLIAAAISLAVSVPASLPTRQNLPNNRRV